MDLLKWMTKTFGRFVGLVLALYGLWLVFVNIASAFGLFGQSQYEPWWILPLIVLAGSCAAAGGIFFLLSLDGPSRFRTRRRRGWSLVLMLAGGLLPTLLTVVVLPLTLLMLPSLFVSFPEESHQDEVPTSS